MLLKTTFEMNQALPDTPSQGGAFGAFGAFEEEEKRWIRVFVAPNGAFFHSDFNATFCYVCKMASTEVFFFFVTIVYSCKQGTMH